MTANEYDEAPETGRLDDDAAVTEPTAASPEVPEPAPAGTDGEAPSTPDEIEDTADPVEETEPDSRALPAEDHEPLSRAARRASTKRSRISAVAVLAALLALSASLYTVVDVLTGYADLALPPVLARVFLGSQALCALLTAAAALVALVRSERRAAKAAENPTLDQALASLAAERARTEGEAHAKATLVTQVADLNAALEAERARTETAAAVVSVAHAERDQAQADLARYLATRPPNETEIREQVTREIAASHQASLAELDAVHERMVAGLHARIADAEGAARREGDARTAAEASVTAACETTRAEERARMRITVQALVMAARDTLGEDAHPVTQFAERFVEAVDRLDGPTVSSPPMPIRAVASRASSDGSEDAGAPKKPFWRSRRK